ncbi:lipid-binding SYLF domain-containing protein [Chitinilyticum piscinae]|uniref:Lipid-binding SYLF domain-containing protein n=1 Tax=Chitinilyticum piscinae TaxID=2866724 RepID=A0A8J7K1P4_9NEIS|nr:lipid-binding SYLF domain-containing protein [Chitinilyticum piscinae]MBE9609506.1 lipid-binding SYLF domain-containing protein [Chitinilyticum piscinae]
MLHVVKRYFLLLLCGSWLLAANASALTASEQTALNKSSQAALQKLVSSVPAAKALHAQAVAVLVFPAVKKGGLVVGGQYGEGVLWRQGKPVAYYSTAGASWGLQAGVQKYGYALFLMNDGAVAALDAQQGFEVGVGPSVVLVDEGMGRSMTTKTIKDDIYAFIFSQKGLMAGLGVQGNKLTRLNQ